MNLYRLIANGKSRPNIYKRKSVIDSSECDTENYGHRLPLY